MKQSAAAILLTLIMCLAAQPAFSGNTDPSGRQLKAYVEDYLNRASPTDFEAARMKNMGEHEVHEWLCNIEISQALSQGYSIWEARFEADKNYQEVTPRNSFIQLNILNYCLTYSKKCSHWEWNKDCLKNKLP